MFLTHATGDYDRCNEDVDPVSASAEYELEKRVELMDIIDIEINKGCIDTIFPIFLPDFTKIKAVLTCRILFVDKWLV